MQYGSGYGRQLAHGCKLVNDDNGYAIGSVVFDAGNVAGCWRPPAGVGARGSDSTLRPSELSMMLDSSSGMTSGHSTTSRSFANAWLVTKILSSSGSRAMSTSNTGCRTGGIGCIGLGGPRHSCNIHIHHTQMNRLMRFTLLLLSYRAGLRHVRGVRPNRAADFRGAAILDRKNPV